jgi:hypothetical protein
MSKFKPKTIMDHWFHQTLKHAGFSDQLADRLMELGWNTRTEIWQFLEKHGYKIDVKNLEPQKNSEHP